MRHGFLHGLPRRSDTSYLQTRRRVSVTVPAAGLGSGAVPVTVGETQDRNCDRDQSGCPRPGPRPLPAPPGRYACLLLSGCQDTEYSYDAYFSGKANGAFTYVALKALAKLKKTATYKDWYASIRKALPSRQHPQTPNLYGATTMKAWKALT